MKLPEYDVTITLSDPDDDSCEFRVVLGRVPREKILTVKVPLKGSLEQFEAMIEDDANDR